MGDEKVPFPSLEEELIMETWCLLKNEEEGDFPPSPHFSFDFKAVAH